jgi:predicted AAA+ superfamily ATPase
LKEDIQNELLTRKVAQFSEFLDLMALSNGEEISYQSIAGDFGVSPNSIKNYIQILEDTLVAFQLKAFTKTRKRKAISRSKLYFFDIGVTNSLAKRGEIMKGSELFGKAFKHFVLLEVRALLSYTRKNIKMCYWRSRSRFEVDLILDSLWGIEIKSAALIQDKHLKGIRALKEEGIIQNFAAVSCDRFERKTQDNITIFPWKIFLRKLWKGDII